MFLLMKYPLVIKDSSCSHYFLFTLKEDNTVPKSEDDLHLKGNSLAQPF